MTTPGRSSGGGEDDIEAGGGGTNTGGPDVVYHVPYPLDPTATSASGIRPVRMREAFTRIGCRVWEVSGDAQSRRRGVRAVRDHLRRGGGIDLAYSESATLPTLLTGVRHLPTHPFLDLGFLHGLGRRGVPVGLFYRDVYWRFPEYRQRVGALVAAGTVPLYEVDLWAYRHSLTRLYLPSAQMAAHVPGIPVPLTRALPPGCEIVARDHHARPGALSLFYVGGLNDHYRMHRCVEAVARTEGASMVLCTRKDGWEALSGEYQPLLGGHTQVAHLSGAELEPLYAGADVAVLAVEPQPYREFAVPFKLFEYIGHGIPVIASLGTLAGDMVQEHGIGWTVPYEVDALSALLGRLRDHPEEVADVAAHVRGVAPQHTWEARARQVVSDLMGA
ncbi:glycosyltransferase family protein [Actinomyces provencensis]|uniref:glycosyltransferase family protein n=1 Tax=Actinomyces provencensis TaxID=1720198 RepID=UPI001177A219|nr:glycosyltransferase [Actinomyces provencensis]